MLDALLCKAESLDLQQQTQQQGFQRPQQQLRSFQGACGPNLLGLVQRALVLHVDKAQAMLTLAVALQVGPACLNRTSF